MAVKILPAARNRILEIWDYTKKKWDEQQADKYVCELIGAINDLPKRRSQWKPVGDFQGLYFFRFSYHYIFFRKLSTRTLGVISILHENMDIPSRLKEDVGQGEDK